MNYPLLMLKRSSLMMLYLAVLLLISIVAIYLLNAGLPLKLMMVFSVLMYLAYLCNRYYFMFGERNVIGLQKTGDESWLLKLKNGDELQVKLLPESVVTYCLCVLQFTLLNTDKKIFLPVLKDSLTAQDYKKLLFFLKWA